MEFVSGNISLVPLLGNATETASGSVIVKDEGEDGDQWGTWSPSAVNVTEGSPPQDIFSYPGVTEVFIFIYSVLWLFCVIGNCLVLSVMTRSPALRTRTNLFLCHLAVADLSVGLVCIIPNLIVAKVVFWIPGPMGTFLCKFYNFFEEFSMTVSVLLLVLIAAERYVAIIHPLQARSLFTRFRMYGALALVWLSSCLYNAPLLFVYVTFDTESHTYCFRDDGEDQPIHMQVYVVLSFLLTYLLPLLLMVTMYLRISLTLWRGGPAGLQGEAAAARVPLEETPRAQPVQGRGRREQNRRPGVRGSKTIALDNSSKESTSCPPTQPMGTDSAGGQKGRTRDGENRSRSSCTSRTSCSSASVSTSNTTGSDDAAADTGRPLFSACRSDVHGVSDQTSTSGAAAAATELCQRDSAANDQTTTPHASCSSRCQRRHSEVPSDGHFYPGIPSSSSAVPLLSSPVSEGTPSSASSPFPSSSPPPPAPGPPVRRSTLATSGCRDGVYVLRSGRTRSASCRYRMTSERVLQKRRKVVRLLIAVLSAFALCVLPFHIRVLLRYWMAGPDLWVTGLPKYIAQVLFFLNSALNPVLYSLMSDSFRRSARQVLCCLHCFRQRHGPHAATLGARDARVHHHALTRTAAAAACNARGGW